MKRKKFAIILFLYFLTITIVGLIIAENISTVWLDTGLIKFNLYDVLMICGIIYVMLYTRSNMNYEMSDTILLINIIYIYILYQVFIIFPTSLINNQLNLSTINILRKIIERMFLILIPFFYWYIIPNFKNPEKLMKFIAYTSLIIFFFHIMNYFTSNYTLTETGNRRYGWGAGGVLLYGFSFITSLNIYNKKRTNYIIIFISILGIILLSQRSAFFAIGFIFIMALVFRKEFNPRIFLSLLGVFLIILGISEFTNIWEDFLSRLTSADVHSGNLYGRLMGWAYGWDIFLQHPLNGIIFNSALYSNELSIDYTFVNIFHNFIMQILVTEGIVGFVFHIIIIIFLFKIAIKNINDTITYQMFFFLLYYFFIAFFNVVYSNPMCYFFLIIPASIILYRNKILNIKYEREN